MELSTALDLKDIIQGSTTDLSTRPRNLALKNWSIDMSRNLPRRMKKFKEWMNKVKEDTDRNLRNQYASIKNLETQIGQLVKDFEAKEAEAEVEACKAIFT